MEIIGYIGATVIVVAFFLLVVNIVYFVARFLIEAGKYFERENEKAKELEKAQPGQEAKT